jgi:hypothetical protein
MRLFIHFLFFCAMDAMETQQPDPAEAIPIVDEVRREFESLRLHFPFLAYVHCGDRACWQLRGLSPFNLDLNITFSFAQITDTMIVGSGKSCLNAYLSSDPSSLGVTPVAIDALVPQWTLCIGEVARMHVYHGELSSTGVVTAIARLMSTQTSDDKDAVDTNAIMLRGTKLQRLEDPLPDPMDADADAGDSDGFAWTTFD